MAETEAVTPEAELARLAADLLGADLGTARAADLDRAVRAARDLAGGRLEAGALAGRLRAAPPDDPLRRAFVEALTISETHFFRIAGQFETLAERVLPALIVGRRSTRRLRLWSAGCSTGEEAWTLAILLERLVPPGWDATVLATDVDESALERARRGVYGARSFRQTPPWVKARWFTARGDRLEVGPRLRRRVRFAPLNLVTDAYPSFESGTSGIDLLLCRNVLIYFTPEARARTADRLARALAPGGWLAVAPAELSAAAFPGLAVRHFPSAILYQRPEPAPPPPAGILLVAIAASTGGPPAVAQILRMLPAGWSVPVLVVQHIGAGFDVGLVRYLDESCLLPVGLAEDGRSLLSGRVHVHVSPADRHLGVTAGPRLTVTAGEPIEGYRPSANHLFRSVADVFGAAAAGVVLTGMGRDGADGLLALRRAGGLAIAQDQATSIVYGMPRQALLRGAAEEVLPIEDIAGALVARAVAPGRAGSRGPG
jgi:chemotaxis methyl-accepting protein methylase